MNARRIYGVILRHLYLLRRSYDKMVDSFYWITLDLIIWGITGLYFQQLTADSKQIIFMIISGVILWNITYRAQSDISLGLIEELWNWNLINLFVSPLTFIEWVIALVALGAVKSVMSFLFGALVAFILYKVGIFFLSIHLLFFMILLLMTGWWLGFTVSAIVLRYGTRVQTLAWTLVWLISPLSAIYYPLSILPVWVQKIAMFVPTSYVFEEGRNLLYNGIVDYNKLLISFGLNGLYLVLSIIFLRNSFDSVLKKGLVKVF